MKRLIRKHRVAIVSLCLVIIVLILAATIIVVLGNKDKTPPEISFDNEVIFLTEDEVQQIKEKDFSSLLRGMTAYDDKDGDLSDKIIVYDVAKDDTELYGIVYYRVMDNKGNVAKIQRIAYTKSMEEIHSYVDTVIAKVLNITLAENESGVETETQNSGVPVLIMQPEITVQVGNAIDFTQFVVALSDDKDSNGTLTQNGRMDGNLDINTVGDYSISFTVTDSDGNTSEPASMVVHVVE